MKNNRIHEFNRIVKENDEIYRGLAKSYGLPDGAFWILYTLREEEQPLTQSDICNYFFMPKQTINSSLKKLEADGYIELLSDNHRSKQIHLTKSGLELANNTVDQVIKAECSTMSQLSEDEQETFMALFHKYTDLLKSNIQDLKK